MFFAKIVNRFRSFTSSLINRVSDYQKADLNPIISMMGP